jgi:Tfp pilus assembly protein PilO
MNTDRLWVFAAVAAMIVIAVGGWFVGISPVVAQAAAADAQVASVTQANTASQAKLALLRQQFANIGPLQKSLESLRQSIPEDADAPAFLQELEDLATANNVTVSSVTIAAATVYQAPGTAAAASSTATTSTPTPTPTPAAVTAPVTPTTSANGQFVQIPVQITVTGEFDAVRSFVGALQLGARLYLATDVGIGQGGAGGAQGTLSGYIFTLQGSSDEPKTKTPSGIPTPAPTGTPVPTGTATSTATPVPGVTSTPTPSLTPAP